MLFDTHTHLNFPEFAVDYPKLIDDCRERQIALVNVGSNFHSSQRAVAIAKEYPMDIYAAVGLHPIHVAGSEFEPEEFDVEKYRALITGSKKVVAVGETGIDLYHSDELVSTQRHVFIQHIALARDHNLSLIIHGRNTKSGDRSAYHEILGCLLEHSWSRGVAHCFAGTLTEAQQFIAQGFYIGITGIVTFKKATNIHELVHALPLEHLVIETDAPYLAPEPYRGQRNQPAYVEYVARAIAEIKGMTYEQVAEQTRLNAHKLFGLA